MAQLKEDEWPTDGEPTTTEEEAGTFKREGPNPPDQQREQGQKNRTPYDSIINNVEPDQQAD